MILPLLLTSLLLGTPNATSTTQDSIKTNYQSGGTWNPQIDTRCDAVMIYGVSDNLKERTHIWKEKGYKVQFMTGTSWGSFTDYMEGKWDGIAHLEEVAQRQENGEIIWHGHKTPYIIPAESFINYMKQQLHKVIDAGITDIFLEEPEIWLRAGYSPAFKKEWEKFYGTPWKAQHESAENTFLSSRLKHHLLINSFTEFFTDLKKYGKEKGLDVKCYVATHSLVNYPVWNIVSPEASFNDIECIDGYIGQVWTGTSRYPNLYNNYYKTRTFETAYMEYETLESMALPAGKDIYFLTDPIEDAVRDWQDYKRGYEATYTAEIMHPTINKYEVMPWPHRIYQGRYRTSFESTETQPIPAGYATQMQIMVNALITMPKGEKPVEGSSGISVLMDNSLMFQRFVEEENFEDMLLSNYYGLVLPLLKRGVPVGVVHMINLKYASALKDTKIIVMSYSSMKPSEKKYHEQLASWVKEGGIILYCGNDDDRFQNVTGWWNDGSAGKVYDRPSDHMFEQMGITGVKPSAGTYNFGKGKVVIIRTNPMEFMMKKNGYSNYLSTLKRIYNKQIGNFTYTNYLKLERSFYDIYSVMDETENVEPVKITGHFVDMFSDSLPVITEKVIQPRSQAMLINLDRIDRSKPQVLATAARVYDEKISKDSYCFITKGPLKICAVTRVYLGKKPVSVKIDGTESYQSSLWDSQNGTYLLKYDANPDGTSIEIKY